MCICYGQDSGSIQETLKHTKHTKLELQAAVLNARLSLVVIKEHDYIIDSTYFWTDSSIVFQWSN